MHAFGENKSDCVPELLLIIKKKKNINQTMHVVHLHKCSLLL